MSETLNPYCVRPYQLSEGDVLGYKVVGIIRDGFWEAYFGLTEWSDEYVLKHGDRITSSAIANGLIRAPSSAGLKYYDGSVIS